ncbi:N-acetyl-gamma-glutamyl-phosphate reductase [Candidatus Magnetomoraceae bacterium gMMP-13]
MNNSIKAVVVGATGYAGAELVRILSDHKYVEITAITSRQYAGVPFSDVYPAMSGLVDLNCVEFQADVLAKKADVFFLALPHKLPMKIVPELIDYGKKVIDLSADFRFQSVSAYEYAYQAHESKDLLKTAVYGLCEIYFDEIEDASLIGNPGCYPTSILLPLIPLVKENLINPNTIIADSKSGTSGAGRSLSLPTHFCEVNEGFKAYKIADHRHCPEMEEILSLESKQDVKITFVPHLVPITRGMLSTIYVNLNQGINAAKIRDCLVSFYKNKPYVRILPENQFPNVMYVRGTNYCDIGIKADERNNRVILVSAIDNLVKGAAGQAVQNMNIMSEFPETAGLENCPFPI